MTNVVSDAGTSGPPRFIWEGTYRSFEDAAADACGTGFSSETHRNRSLAVARECLTAMKAGKPIPQIHKQRTVLLPAVVATLLGTRERLRILDFGGGLGIGYLTLLEAVSRAAERIDYRIVEVASVVDEGRRLFGDTVAYVETLPAEGSFDLVYTSSAMQYVEDWPRLVASLAAYRADSILLSDVFAGAIPTFVTLQNYYGSRIRHWFLNLDDLLEAFSRTGYTLAMKTCAAVRRLDVESTLRMEHFPATHRLEQSLNLILHRRT